MTTDARSPSVLVAEDDAELRAVLCQQLRDRGCAVEPFGDGEALLRALTARFDERGTPPDLVVTDVRMPGRSGLEVLARLRRFDRVTPVIVISAFSDREVSAQAERLGALLLDKPFDLDALWAAAERCGVAP